MGKKSWLWGMGISCCSIAACVFLVSGGSQSVFAHGGGLPRHGPMQGCHQKRATGECHCHRDKHDRKLNPPVPCEGGPKDEPKDNRSEADFVAVFCHARDGRVEESLPHRMRADCITETHAIEGDFARKWDEAFKQAQHYAIEADKKAGVLLILKNENDKVFIKKLCDRIAEKNVSIDVFAIGHGFAEQGESVFCPDEI